MSARSWLRYNIKAIRGIRVHARPDLDPAFIGLVVADNVHIRLGELDDAFFLELLDGLNDA